MAVVSILDAFTYKWAQLGTAEAITDDQWKVGWSFIGAVPPSVEQFNKWGQISDEKSNYLYSQLNTIYGLTGVTPGAADVNSLRDALRGTGLFQTAAVGTDNTSVATTAFVRAAANTRGVALITTLGASTWTVPAGVFRVEAATWGASGGGGGNSVAAGGGGGGAGAGGYSRGVYAVTPGQVINCVVGAGGVADPGTGGGVGGSTSFGAFLSATGGSGGATGGAGPGTGGAGGTGSGGQINLTGQAGGSGTSGSGVGGSGGAAPFGGTGGIGGGATALGGTGAFPGGGAGGHGGQTSGTSAVGTQGAIEIRY